MPLTVLPRIVGVVEIIRCPGCRALRYDDGTFCPECGEYANPEVRPNRIVKERIVRCTTCSQEAAMYLYGRPICGREVCKDAMRESAIAKLMRA